MSPPAAQRVHLVIRDDRRSASGKERLRAELQRVYPEDLRQPIWRAFSPWFLVWYVTWGATPQAGIWRAFGAEDASGTW